MDKMLCILPFEPDFYNKWNYVSGMRRDIRWVEVIKAAREQSARCAVIR